MRTRFALIALLTAGLASPVAAQSDVGRTFRLREASARLAVASTDLMPVVEAEAVSSAVSDSQPAKPAPRRGPTVALGGFGLFDLQSMTAKDTFDAVFGSSQMTGGGAGAEVLFGSPFVRFSFSRASKVGSRVFFHNNETLPNNVALTLKLRTIEIGGGWRVPIGRARRYAAYGGAGLLRVNYEESSDFAGPGENIRDSFTGYTAFGGFDVRIWKWVYAGVEGQYRAVPDALGDGGVSQQLGDTDLGGTAIRILFGVRK